MISFTLFETKINKEMTNLLIPIPMILFQMIQGFIHSKNEIDITFETKSSLHIDLFSHISMENEILTSI